MDPAPWMLWLPLLIPVGFILLLFIVALAEKRITNPYVVFPSHVWVELPPYVQEMGAEIEAVDFTFGGIVAHAKYPSTKIMGCVWLSPMREILVLTGSGKVFGMQSKQTWLYTPLADGTYLCTTDQNDEGDHSKLMRVRRLINLRFNDLLQLHAKRIMAEGAQVRSFAEATPGEALIGLVTRKAATLVSLGRAKWIDPQQKAWRYTVLGGVCVCTNFFAQLFFAFGQFWRVNKRPIAAPVANDHDQQIALAFQQAASPPPAGEEGEWAETVETDET
jgi:hypothetical protein